jgi:hypothetical protein
MKKTGDGKIPCLLLRCVKTDFYKFLMQHVYTAAGPSGRIK